jgi:transposase
MYLGVDIAKNTFVAARWTGGRGERWGSFPNTPGGWEQLQARVAQAQPSDTPQPVVLVLEPTGGYELALAVAADAAGWQVSRPNPRHVRAWSVGRGRRAKTDQLDAVDLAAYGTQHPQRRWRPLPPAIAELEALVARQADLEHLLRAERNRQLALAARPSASAAVAASLAAVLTTLQTSLAEIQAAIKAHLKAHPRLRAQARQLQSVPGIGPRTVLPLLVLLARWESLTEGQGRAKGLVAFTGLDPRTQESGTSVRGPRTISRQGAGRTRSQLYMAALGGVRGRNPLQDFYKRLLGRGKAKKLALVAAARKILIWAWAVYRTDTPFDRARHVASQPLQPAQTTIHA